MEAETGATLDLIRIMWIMIQYYPSKLKQALFNEILVRVTYIVEMIAFKNFYDIFFRFFYPTASATAEVCQGQTLGYGGR